MGWLVIDAFAQSSAEMLSILDVILKWVSVTNTYMSGLIIFFTLNHLQTQPIRERHLLTSPSMMPYFHILILKTSVRAAADPDF